MCKCKQNELRWRLRPSTYWLLTLVSRRYKAACLPRSGRLGLISGASVILARDLRRLLKLSPTSSLVRHQRLTHTSYTSLTVRPCPHCGADDLWPDEFGYMFLRFSAPPFHLSWTSRPSSPASKTPWLNSQTLWLDPVCVCACVRVCLRACLCVCLLVFS